LGKIGGDADDFAMDIEASGFKELPVSARHAAAVATLPLHHTEPPLAGTSGFCWSGRVAARVPLSAAGSELPAF